MLIAKYAGKWQRHSCQVSHNDAVSHTDHIRHPGSGFREFLFQFPNDSLVGQDFTLGRC